MSFFCCYTVHVLLFLKVKLNKMITVEICVHSRLHEAELTRVQTNEHRWLGLWLHSTITELYGCSEGKPWVFPLI